MPSFGRSAQKHGEAAHPAAWSRFSVRPPGHIPMKAMKDKPGNVAPRAGGCGVGIAEGSGHDTQRMLPSSGWKCQGVPCYSRSRSLEGGHVVVQGTTSAWSSGCPIWATSRETTGRAGRHSWPPGASESKVGAAEFTLSRAPAPGAWCSSRKRPRTSECPECARRTGWTSFSDCAGRCDAKPRQQG